ncbi:MAG: hypothetical protein Q9163_005690 [Psora crenata]
MLTRSSRAAALCHSVSTVYVTVPASPVTETIYAATAGTGLEGSSINENDRTVLNTLPATQVFSVVEASSSPSKEVKAVATVRSTILITVSGTITVTETEASTTFEPTSTVSGTAQAYTGLAPTGWNATTLTIAKLPSTKLAYSKPIKTESDKPKQTRSSPRASAFHVKARDIGDSVIATVEGKVVSWSNNYEGSTTASSTAIASSTPLDAVPIYPWDVNPSSSSQGPISSSSVASSTSAPVTVLPIYPWDPLPAQVSSAKTSDLFTTSAATTSSTAATAEPISCGNSSASFTITFDDLPHFSISNDPQGQDIPPIFNPYRKLYFEEHFGYVPPPSDPYPPHSPPQLAVYRASGAASDGSPSAGLEASGEIGAGPHASDSAYWIDAHSAYLGCADGTPSACLLTIQGHFNDAERPVVAQLIELPSCPGLQGCSLISVEFDSIFRGMSGFQITAAVGNKPVDYYMDDLALAWSNNTCAAQQERASSK